VVEIIQATTPEQVDQVRALFLEYADYLRVDLRFQGFTEELAALPGDYAPPNGRLFLALDDGQSAGCIALHPLDLGVCEMKRLYVRPSYRGKHIGRLLAQRLLDDARAIGYKRMKLDSIRALKEACVLYQSLGFVECAPYRYNPFEDAVFMELNLRPVQVFKVSGTDLDDPAFSRRFADAIAAVSVTGGRPIVVHGGGKELTELLSAFQIESRFVDGLRVTDARTRDAALMTLSGLANKRLVAAFLAAGVDAIGVSGIDGGLVRVRKLNEALQFVGKPVSVRASLLQSWLDAGIVPVIAPMSIGEDGEIYNVNADHVAGAVSAAVDATMLTFITNVTAVLGKDGVPIKSLTLDETESLIRDGTITGGMIPKVRTALEALADGVKSVRITNLYGVSAGTGTTFTQTR
jgi:acetylglutamate kinase